MKVAVVGSRSFNDYKVLKKVLDEIKEHRGIGLMVSGGAVGADLLGEKWANENSIPTKIFLPNWNEYGKRAGFIRNVDIVREADLVVAFWDGESKGTMHSITLAEKENKECIVIGTKFK